MAEQSEASEAAERYAQAAFDLASEAKSLDALEADFAALTAAFAESADLRVAAASPLIDPQEKAKAFGAVAVKMQLSELGRNVVGVVAQNGRARELPQIATAFRRLLARQRGALQAEIVSAKPLSDADKKSILDALAASMGKQIQAETRVDESLIGGFIVRVGSRQFDSSLKTKLAGLQLALKQAS